MERLTKRIDQHVYYTRGKYTETLPAEMDTADTRKALERLAAYEDAGLEPEEITRLKSERDAAVEDMRIPVCLACGKYRVTCRPKRDKLADGCQTFTWRGPQKEAGG